MDYICRIDKSSRSAAKQKLHFHDKSQTLTKSYCTLLSITFKCRFLKERRSSITKAFRVQQNTCNVSAHRLDVVDKDPGPLHLLHLRDALLDVRHEPLLVVVRPAGEGGRNTTGVSLLQLNAELEVLSPEHVHLQVREAQAEPVVVQLLLLRFLRLGDHQQVIKEEETSLVGIFLLFLVHVRHLTDSAEADKTPPGSTELWSLVADNCLLDLADLGHVVGALLELAALNPVVDASQHFTIDVRAAVDSSQIPDKILRLHPPL